MWNVSILGALHLCSPLLPLCALQGSRAWQMLVSCPLMRLASGTAVERGMPCLALNRRSSSTHTDPAPPNRLPGQRSQQKRLAC